MRLTLPLFLFALSFGCQSPEPTRTAPAAASAPEVKEDDPGYILQSHKPGAKASEGCHQDQECIPPLRCIHLSCAVPPGIEGEALQDTPHLTISRQAATLATLSLEVADTFYERQQGLMFRTRLHQDWGMLFIFPNEQPRSFWMRNTFLPLDMLFLDGGGKVVAIVKRALPLEEEPRYISKNPAKYVLEVNAGYASERGLKVGDQVTFSGLP